MVLLRPARTAATWGLPAALALLCAAAACGQALAEKGSYVDTVRFVQYLDENTALEEVRNGNLDVYYSRIPADRLEGAHAREGLRVYDSTGGSYSILANPAESDRFNPFSIRDVRFALNYLVDRKLIVNELMGGLGSPSVSYYGRHDPGYLTVIGQLESYDFRYNPRLAGEMISGALLGAGAERSDGRWIHGGEPVGITIFIRSDDPVRKSIGEILASELEGMGFAVSKDFGDLNKAFVVVYGSDPAELRWNLYTEGWGRSAFVRYDSAGLGQMYAPWFSNMPGFNDPGYWNYENGGLDEVTQRIYTGDFETEEQRAGLVREAVTMGIDESVRIFLASNVDRYVTNDGVSGVVNDFGAGVPSRFTPINARTGGGELVVGVKQIYQGAWNPVMGLSDSYSTRIWGIVADPASFKHPFTGEALPVRASWDVETAGPRGGVEVPAGAVMWDVGSQAWEAVPAGTEATSRVTFDLAFGNWHHGRPMDMLDVLHSLYFAVEWGTRDGPDDRTFDSEFTPRAAQVTDTLVGVRQVDADTIEAYVDYWHFDEGEIAEWASLWSVVPWEISAAMEQAVVDGKASFSRSGATAKNVSWLSLLVPNDAQVLRGYLEGFRAEGRVPAPAGGAAGPGYAEDRYDAAIGWIEDNGHAVISNGPFYVDSYSPESRTITVRAFDDGTYPFAAGRWSEFEDARYPSIAGVDVPGTVQRGGDLAITVASENADSVMYFLAGGDGRIVASGEVGAGGGVSEVTIPGAETGLLAEGGGSVRVFAVSADVLRPDAHSAGFLVVDGPGGLPAVRGGGAVEGDGQGWWAWVAVPAAAAAALAAAARLVTRGRTPPG